MSFVGKAESICSVGAFPVWVKLRRTQCEHMFSALPSNSDIARCIRHVSKVPNSDIVPLYPECGVFLCSCQRRSFFRMHILSSLTTRTCKMNMESCYEHHSNSGFSN